MQQEQEKGLVFIIGVLDQKGSTNIPMALSTIKCGFRILPINYRTIMQKYGYLFFKDLVINLVKNHYPDLVIICKGNNIYPDLITEITKYTKTWIYNMDPKPTIDMVPEVRENAKIATFSSCTALDMVQEWQSLGANCFHTIQGLDEEIFKPTKPVKKYKADISLIGSKTPQRDEYKEYLENAGFNVKFYGHGYSTEEVLDKEFAKVCASSKYMLSLDSIAGLHQHYFSNRLVRYLGCGACTFHFDPTGTLEQYFQNNIHLKYFTSPAELVQQIKVLEEPELIEELNLPYEIAMNGMDKVLREYTWDSLMFALLQTALPEQMGITNDNTISQSKN